ncbi:hypothetical protein DPMN_147280 [Dreissena polymorpha]|uniref:Uncharacterized protein n=1 Tax=Dreissena polymorpha TaxID=45954 RepID=A0A9D4IZ73_DREPO|nr:hypothetical protein DPMN_147280 [Dreissena polymorpha]
MGQTGWLFTCSSSYSWLRLAGSSLGSLLSWVRLPGSSCQPVDMDSERTKVKTCRLHVDQHSIHWPVYHERHLTPRLVASMPVSI